MKLVPIVILVNEATLADLESYVAHVENILHLDAPDLELAVIAATGNGWTPEMLIGGQLLQVALDGAKT